MKQQYQANQHQQAAAFLCGGLFCLLPQRFRRPTAGCWASCLCLGIAIGHCRTTGHPHYSGAGAPTARSLNRNRM